MFDKTRSTKPASVLLVEFSPLNMAPFSWLEIGPPKLHTGDWCAEPGVSLPMLESYDYLFIDIANDTTRWDWGQVMDLIRKQRELRRTPVIVPVGASHAALSGLRGPGSQRAALPETAIVFRDSAMTRQMPLEEAMLQLAVAYGDYTRFFDTALRVMQSAPSESLEIAAVHADLDRATRKLFDLRANAQNVLDRVLRAASLHTAQPHELWPSSGAPDLERTPRYLPMLQTPRSPDYRTDFGS